MLLLCSKNVWRYLRIFQSSSFLRSLPSILNKHICTFEDLALKKRKKKKKTATFYFNNGYIFPLDRVLKIVFTYVDLKIMPWSFYFISVCRMKAGAIFFWSKLSYCFSHVTLFSWRLVFNPFDLILNFSFCSWK